MNCLLVFALLLLEGSLLLVKDLVEGVVFGFVLFQLRDDLRTCVHPNILNEFDVFFVEDVVFTLQLLNLVLEAQLCLHEYRFALFLLIRNHPQLLLELC